MMLDISCYEKILFFEIYCQSMKNEERSFWIFIYRAVVYSSASGDTKKKGNPIDFADKSDWRRWYLGVSLFVVLVLWQIFTHFTRNFSQVTLYTITSFTEQKKWLDNDQKSYMSTNSNSSITLYYTFRLAHSP